MNAKLAGIVFIAAAVLLVVLFAIDQLVSAPRRGRGVLAPQTDSPPSEDIPLPHGVPTPQDVVEDLLREQAATDLFTREELELARRSKDYEYQVKVGDSVDEVARKYLGDATLKSRIFEVNPGLVPGAGLRAGEKIIIPFRYRR